jgi:hypothetical protein
MDSLQKALEKALATIPETMLAKLVWQKLSEQGITITQRRAEILAGELRKGKTHMTIPDKRTGTANISISNEEIKLVFQNVEKFLEDNLADLIEKTRGEMAPPFLANLKKRWPAEKLRQQRVVDRFRKNLRLRWSRGLSKYAMLIRMARELGSYINQETRASATEQNADLVDVLTRLHIRACQVAEEVLVLLQNGFANGAMARWRTMHEIEVSTHFIGKYGNECAKRYRDHQFVESYRGAHEYEVARERLGYAEIPVKDREEIDKEYKRVLQKHGNEFGGQYGWAAADLQIKKPTFKDLQSEVGVDYLRGHYRMASHGVHANPRGIYFSLTSLFPSDEIVAGASNAGLADAGEGAARALVSISAALLSLSPSLDHQVAIMAMQLLQSEIASAFLQAHWKLHHDESKLRELEAAGNVLLAQHGITDDSDDFRIALSKKSAPHKWRKRRGTSKKP